MAPEIVTIRDNGSGTTARILAGFGFNCFSLQVMQDDGPLEVLWSAPDFARGLDRPSGSGIPILFPFPGRIRGVEFQWEGQTYRFKDGDGRGNAIHGLVHEQPWRVIELTESRVVGQFQLSQQDVDWHACWPVDFRIIATYEVKDRALKTRYLVENPADRPLPCGLGTHPYFRVPLGGSHADSCVIKLPIRDEWELEGMIPTGIRRALENPQAFQSGLRFGDMSLDNVFGGLLFSGERCTSSVHDPLSGRTLMMNFDRTFRVCVVYNPSHREAVCIEPYTCVPDPFRLEREGVDAGLRVLAPHASFGANIEIRVE